ncbi:MAG: AzlC family ABC transporter permease [Candidatus Riflebacteria bacterium]|nr:AzlC family ABC transporter permease [Candidatus Riflebacteria bacterium]
MSRFNDFRLGFRDGAPIGFGYFTVSFAFGILASQKGLSVFQAVLMSATNLTSAGQFAALDIIYLKLSYYELALTQIILNLRYFLMSCALSQKIEPETKLKHRLIASFGITDEIFAINASKPGKVSPYYTYGAMCIAIPGWTLGTFLGAFSDNLMSESLKSALGVAIYGMFIAILIPPAKKSKNILAVVVSSAFLAWLFKNAPVLSQVSSGFTIIIITIVISAAAAYLRPIKEQ